MPRLPRLSSREAIRALEKLGYVQVRQKGSHIVLKRGSQICVVPQRKELRIGTLTGILDQADVAVEELLAALK